MLAIWFNYRLIVCKLGLRCIIGIHLPFALKRRPDNRGLGRFR
jgi:hypothetical protein